MYPSLTKKYRFITLFLVLVIGCNGEPEGLQTSIPVDSNINWTFDMYSYTDAETTAVGTVTLQNVETLSFEGNEGVLRQRRFRRLDSLSNTSDSVRTASTYYNLKDLEYEIFAEDFYDVYDTMLPSFMLDTLMAQEPDGPDFQFLYDYQPRWVTVARFDEHATSSYSIFDEQRFYVDFQYEEHHITGHMDIKATGLFWGFETISTPYRDSIQTYVIKNSTHFDFDLMKDSTDIPDERETIDIFTWYHEDGGIVKRQRTPFSLKIPTIPSRYPVLYHPGELWVLRDIFGYDF